MVSDDAQIAEAKAAWARIKEHGRKSWDDWLTVATAVRIGRDAAMRTAGCNRPFGSRYSKAMGDWLSENQLDVGVQVRSRLMQILEHRSEIEAWRDSLDEAKRQRCHHPDSAWFGWKRSVIGKPARAPMSRPDRPPNPTTCSRAGFHKPSQDLVRVLAKMLHENWTVDTYPLASALLASMREHREEFLEFLTAEPPPPKPAAPRRSAAPAAAELHA